MITEQTAIVLGPGEGRRYPLGRMTSIFKSDGEETSGRYSISEWWLEPYTRGPGKHVHSDNEDIFYVIEGRVAFLVGDQWIDAAKGSFVRVPAGVIHDFENQSPDRAGVLNIYIPGGFEDDMPGIVDWFQKNPVD
ncbi:cupin domain-containing protein [Asticcacaulis endophyticus]|jgi:mannose-6-phosphate isomerase-like protein (cupin superfamily)|uniref:Cupin type-2 domain-containing protein n=1 Tax=Asticcacaulis endophyticus TaxID=1395890 RepID=A0A918PWD7_9CAUL|nr:cupin domain-containing protein [Asticcacaulis endophyticus]GGZ24343.1 hypothetical protein GCM10011273_06920 [Asticcacaulis endophyticus]